MTEPKLIGFVAEFHKAAGKRLELRSMTIERESDGYRGKRVVSHDIYDVDFSKRYGYMYHMSGSDGGDRPTTVSGPYFMRGKIRIKEAPTRLISPDDNPPFRSKKTRAIRALNKTRRLRELPGYFRGHGNLWNWLIREGIETEPVYCSVCKDYFPEDSRCKHIWWCEETYGWSTPSERCGCSIRSICEGDETAETEAFSLNHPRLLEAQWWE